MNKILTIIVSSIIVITSPINAQFFIPFGMTDSTVTRPLNDPVGKPYGGGAGYFPIITQNNSDIVINTNDFNYLKSQLANASYGDIVYLNDNL